MKEEPCEYISVAAEPTRKPSLPVSVEEELARKPADGRLALTSNFPRFFKTFGNVKWLDLGSDKIKTDVLFIFCIINQLTFILSH